VKIYERAKLQEANRRNSVLREIRIMAKLDHKNVTTLYESIDTPKFVKTI
jgi:serine/threonine protein kinase